jgi:hypothetical protein
MNTIWALAISFSIFSLGTSAMENPNYMDIILKKYPKCEYKKENIFITKKQKSSIETRTGRELFSRLGLRFKIVCNKSTTYAYVDSHIVRTLNETLVIFVKNNSVSDLKVAVFNEPPEYKTPIKWNQQFFKKSNNHKLTIGADIDGLSGATLTSHAINDTVKRILSIHSEIKIDKK